MKEPNQIELHCPKCNNKLIADIDLEKMVQERAERLLTRVSDPRTIKSLNPEFD